MKFAGAKLIVVMSVVTCAALFALDYVKNPQLWHHEQEHEMAMGQSGAHLTLWMNHLCCTTCLDEVRTALAAVPGLDAASATGPKELLTAAEADKLRSSPPDYGGPVDVKVADLEKLDFAALDRALRADGLVAGRIELGGVPHFRFEASFPRLCCAGEKATREGIDFLKASAHGGQLTWLDSLNVDRDKNTVVVYARYLEPNKTVDVAELLSGLNSIGYSPVSLRVLVGEDTKLAEQK